MQCLCGSIPTVSKYCQMYISVFIVGLYLQYLLLDALQCLYRGSIHIVNIVTCIAMSLLWVYTYSIYCQMHCSVYCWFIPIVNIVRCIAVSLLQVYTCSICCQIRCSVYCGSISIVNIVRCIAVSLLLVYTYNKCCQMQCSVFILGLYLR